MNNPIRSLAGWFDTYRIAPGSEADGEKTIDWLRVLPFLLMHVACLSVLFVGVSGFAVAVLVVTYAIRVFGITVGYHRYFSHRAFKTGRFMQFVIACCGAASMQRGPLWWAAHHRQHHKMADTDGDCHSPVQHGFLWSHMGWFLAKGNFRSRLEAIKDFASFPELVFIDRYDTVVPVVYGVLLFLLGGAVGAIWPESGTSGLQTLVWGGVVSTVLIWHVTFAINSLTHSQAPHGRRYLTKDQSRNVAWLAPVTFGESWHNNHHRFPASSRLGFFWWEVDVGYWALLLLERLGLVRQLRIVPVAVRDEFKP